MRRAERLLLAKITLTSRKSLFCPRDVNKVEVRMFDNSQFYSEESRTLCVAHISAATLNAYFIQQSLKYSTINIDNI